MKRVFLIFVLIVALSIPSSCADNKKNKQEDSLVVSIENPFYHPEFVKDENAWLSIKDVIWEANAIILMYGNSQEKSGAFYIYNLADKSYSEIYNYSYSSSNRRIDYIARLDNGDYCLQDGSKIVFINANYNKTRIVDLNQLLAKTKWRLIDEGAGVVGITQDGRYGIVHVENRNVLLLDLVQNRIITSLKDFDLSSKIYNTENSIFAILVASGGPSYVLLKYDYDSGKHSIIPDIQNFYISHDSKYLITTESAAYSVRDIKSPENVVRSFNYTDTLYGERAKFISDKYCLDINRDGIKAFRLDQHTPINIYKSKGFISNLFISPNASSLLFYDQKERMIGGTLYITNLPKLLDMEPTLSHR